MANLRKLYSMQRKLSQIQNSNPIEIQLAFIDDDAGTAAVTYRENTTIMSLADYFLEQSKDKDLTIINLMAEDDKLIKQLA